MHARTFLRAAQLRGSSTSPGLMAGVDEVGRGPLAGPVVAAAVILDEKRPIRGLNDSKLLSAKRERLDLEIREARALLQRRLGQRRRDRRDQHPARRAAGDAARGRRPARCSRSGPRRRQPAAAADDAVRTIVGGDAKVKSISAASIIAKVHRDRLCLQLHDEHPHTVSTATRATRRPSTSPRCAARRLPAPSAQLRAGARACSTALF